MTAERSPALLDDVLDRLDAALLAARQWPRRPRHRRYVRERLGTPIELAMVRLLRAIESAPGDDPTIGEVAALLGVDPSTASRVIDRAVDRGAVERRPCTDDRRRTRLVLTTVGGDLLDAVGEARRTVLGEVTAGWEPRDLEVLAGLLEALGQRFDDFEASG